MLVSVIIPNYNHARFLEQRIASVLNQTYQNIELIILDDASSDRSREIMEQYKNHSLISHIIFNEENSGSPFRQWEKGINLAKGDLIWIAESDDYAAITLVETAVNAFKKHQNIGLFFCNSIGVDEQGKNIGKDTKAYTQDFENQYFENDFTMLGVDFIHQFLLHKNVIQNASGVIFKRDFIKNIPKITDYQYAGDWLFWILGIEKHSVFYTSKGLNYFRHTNQSSRNRPSVEEKRQRIWEEMQIMNVVALLPTLDIKEKNLPDLIQKWTYLFDLKDIVKKELYRPFAFQYLKPYIHLIFVSSVKKKLSSFIH